MTGGSVSWGDYDADGDLDLALSGYTADGLVSKIYRNNGEASNTAPAAPEGLTVNVIGNTVTFSWAPASDNETPATGLSYNLRVGTSPGGGDIFAGMADLSTGLRRIAEIGNVQQQLSWSLSDLSLGTIYYWSVQGIDTTFAGSPWATEATFNTPLPGDANRDGMVSADDYASVQSNIGNTGGIGIPGDANLDGTVSADDHASVQANFGNVAGMGGAAVVFETAGEPINIISIEPLVDPTVNIDGNSTPNQIAKGIRFYTPAMATNRENIAIIPLATNFLMPTLYNSTDDKLVAAAEGREASPFAMSSMLNLAPGRSYKVYLWAHADEDPDTYNLQELTDTFDSVLETDEANYWSTLPSGNIV